MGKQEEYERLNGTIKDCEVRIRTLQSHIANLDRELASLISTEMTLLDNIKCLKSNKIVAIVQEFKKSKEELKRVKGRIQILRTDKGIFEKDIANLTVSLEYSKKSLEKLQEDNVLTFGKKDG